jgi:plasmid stabilization system protein ParE
MAYRINFTRRARRDYLALYESINAAESVPAQLWFNRLDETIALLAVTPRMGFVTHEDQTVRQVIYGNKPHVYRILYDIDDADRRVDILSIWHGKRLPPTFLKD